MGDLIDREEAIKAVKFYETFYDPYPRVIEALEQLPSVQPELDKENGECNDCIKHGGDWECDRVHCHKGDAISRQDAIDAIYKEWDGISYDGDGYHIASECERVLDELPSVQPQKGKWIDYSDEGYVECPFCHSATNCDGNKDELHYCFSCGAELR